MSDTKERIFFAFLMLGMSLVACERGYRSGLRACGPGASHQAAGGDATVDLPLHDNLFIDNGIECNEPWCSRYVQNWSKNVFDDGPAAEINVQDHFQEPVQENPRLACVFDYMIGGKKMGEITAECPKVWSLTMGMGGAAHPDGEGAANLEIEDGEN